MAMPTTEAEAKALLQRLARAGCPKRWEYSPLTPADRENASAACHWRCLFCRARLELQEPHHADCLWLEIERVTHDEEDET